MDPKNGKLDELLKSWDEVCIDHPRLNQRVWSRIAVEDEEATALPGFFKLAHTVLSRPVYASAFLVSCVLLGLLLAEVRVSQQQAERGERLAESYKQVIDPLLKNTHLFE